MLAILSSKTHVKIHRVFNTKFGFALVNCTKKMCGAGRVLMIALTHITYGVGVCGAYEGVSPICPFPGAYCISPGVETTTVPPLPPPQRVRDISPPSVTEQDFYHPRSGHYHDGRTWRHAESWDGNGPIRIFRSGFPQHLHTIYTSVLQTNYTSDTCIQCLQGVQPLCKEYVSALCNCLVRAR